MADDNPSATTTAAGPPEPAQPTVEEVVTEEVVKSILTNHDSDLELVSYEAKVGSQAGDNYMSIMYAVTIKMRRKSDPSEIKDLVIMLKTMPRNAFRQKMINDMMAFEKEARTYTEILGDFTRFQKDKGLRDEQLYTAYPTCYSTFLNGTTDFLALEDLKVSGFKMGNRLIGLDFDHCRLVLTNLGKYHALSAATFNGDYDAILSKYPFIREMMFKTDEDTDPMYRSYMTSIFSSEADKLREAGYEKEGDDLAAIYDDSFYTKMYKLTAQKCKFPVICHGDCWTNNMLFSYDSDGKPIGHKFIDFQIGRAASRCTDLGYFFYSSLPLNVLNEQEDELLSIYHESFTNFCKLLGYVNSELTFENLKKEFSSYRLFGVAMGLMLAPMLSAKSEDVPDMENMEVPTDENIQEQTQEFMSAFMKSDQLTKKLLNFAVHHIPKLQGVPVGDPE